MTIVKLQRIWVSGIIAIIAASGWATYRGDTALALLLAVTVNGVWLGLYFLALLAIPNNPPEIDMTVGDDVARPTDPLEDLERAADLVDQVGILARTGMQVDDVIHGLADRIREDVQLVRKEQEVPREQ